MCLFKKPTCFYSKPKSWSWGDLKRSPWCTKVGHSIKSSIWESKGQQRTGNRSEKRLVCREAAAAAASRTGNHSSLVPLYQEQEKLTIPIWKKQFIFVESKHSKNLTWSGAYMWGIWTMRPLQPSWIQAKPDSGPQSAIDACWASHIRLRNNSTLGEGKGGQGRWFLTHIASFFFYYYLNVQARGDERGPRGKYFTEKPEQSCQEEMKGIKHYLCPRSPPA